MNKILVVVDMQNDFIDGALGTPEAQAIVPKVVEKIKNWDGVVMATQDTHFQSDYYESLEGQRLPVIHCQYKTRGWEIHNDIQNVCVPTTQKPVHTVTKWAFGSEILATSLQRFARDDCERVFDEIHLCGICTDICVIVNAMTLKTFCPEARIVVDASCCAGTTPEAHEIALKAMRQCQIDIENWEFGT